MGKYLKQVNKISDGAALGIVVANMIKAGGRNSPRVLMAATGIVSANVIMGTTTDAKGRYFNYLQFLKGLKSAMQMQAHAEGVLDPFSFEHLTEEEVKPSGLELPKKIPLVKS